MKYLTPSFSVGGASESFDEGYERTFGKKRERNAGKRYIYRETSPGVVEAIEIGAEWTDAPKSTGDLGKFEYGQLMTDGKTYVKDASDYRKYLKETGLVPSQEFKGQWAEAEKKRDAIKNSESRSTAERRDRLGRELYRRVKSFRG